MSDELKANHQRPEGKLIEDAISRAPKMSARKLATAIDMSDARVRQIINGYAFQGGKPFPVTGPAKTVAKMALALDMAPALFINAGREDVAEAMADLLPVDGVDDIDWAKVGDLDDHAADLRGHVNINVMFSQAVRFAATVGILVPEVRDDAERVSASLSALFTRAHELWDRGDPLDKYDDGDDVLILPSKPLGGDGNADSDTGGSAPTSDELDLAADQDYELTPQDEAEQTETST